MTYLDGSHDTVTALIIKEAEIDLNDSVEYHGTMYLINTYVVGDLWYFNWGNMPYSQDLTEKRYSYMWALEENELDPDLNLRPHVIDTIQKVKKMLDHPPEGLNRSEWANVLATYVYMQKRLGEDLAETMKILERKQFAKYTMDAIAALIVSGVETRESVNWLPSKEKGVK